MAYILNITKDKNMPTTSSAFAPAPSLTVEDLNLLDLASKYSVRGKIPIMIHCPQEMDGYQSVKSSMQALLSNSKLIDNRRIIK